MSNDSDNTNEGKKKEKSPLRVAADVVDDINFSDDSLVGTIVVAGVLLGTVAGGVVVFRQGRNLIRKRRAKKLR